MARVYHKCPITGKKSNTGIDVPEGMLNDFNLYANSYQCEHCGGIHQWNGSQAFQIKEALLNTPNPRKEAKHLIKILKKVHDQSAYEEILSKNRKIKKHKGWLPKDFKDLAIIIQIILTLIQILPKQSHNSKNQNIEINNHNYYHNQKEEKAERDSVKEKKPKKIKVKKGKIRKTIYV